MKTTQLILAELRELNPADGWTRRILSVTGPSARVALGHLERQGHIEKMPGMDRNAQRYRLLPPKPVAVAKREVNPLRPTPKDGQAVVVVVANGRTLPAVYRIDRGFVVNEPCAESPVGWAPR